MGVEAWSQHSIHTHLSVMQALYVVPLLAAAASAAPQLLVGGHAPPVHGIAAPLAEVSPYNFNYAVADDYSASNFQAAESSDGLGVKTGSYSVALPDGRTQTVNYSTDDVNGYVADVSYEGVPQYPP